MSWRAQTSAAELRPLFASFLYILEKVGAVSLIVGTVHSCAPTPLPFIAPEPFDAGAPATATHYHSTIGAYVSQRPVRPGSWREQNARVTRSSDHGRDGGSEHEH